jgi:hypothetical protein
LTHQHSQPPCHTLRPKLIVMKSRTEPRGFHDVSPALTVCGKGLSHSWDGIRQAGEKLEATLAWTYIGETVGHPTRVVSGFPPPLWGSLHLSGRHPARRWSLDIAGLKARHVTACGEAHAAEPQVNIPNISAPPCKGGTFVGNGVLGSGPSGLANNLPRVSRASARDARSSPGCHIAGFQPASETGKNVDWAAFPLTSVRLITLLIVHVASELSGG